MLAKTTIYLGGWSLRWSALVSVLCCAAIAAAAEKAPPPEQMPLWPGPSPIGNGQTETAGARLTLHRPPPDKANGAALVICPGGGYGGLMIDPEGHGIAEWLNRHGITGIVLEYRLPHGRPMVPLLDAQRALRTVRSKAAEWKLDPHKIGIIGFSAGGHLASTAGTHFDEGDSKAADPIDRVSCRPDFVLLVYPVVTMGPKTHQGSKNNLLGPNPTPELVNLFSNEKQVTAHTPPMFMAHAKDDGVVVPANSEMLYEALKSHHVPAEYVELPNGGHGLNGYKGSSWDTWQARSLKWLAERGFIPERDAE
jgi:acetyl esterase/lipase